MAYCDYCNKGIGPQDYQIIFHKKGMFGGHASCIPNLIKRLDKCDLDKKKEKN